MIREIRKEYQDGKIDAKQYSKKMFKAYEILNELGELLEESMVEKVEISKEKIIITAKKNKNEIKMFMYPVDSAAVPATILSFGQYEVEELDMVLNLLNMLDDDSTIFDIGANLGWYTLNILKNNTNRNVYSFEPIEETYFKLKENLKLNNVETTKLYNFGLYKENKKMEFFYDTTASGASSLADLRELETTKKVVCEFKKMDDFIKENSVDRLDFIKCDVEGSELFVYQGGIESIEKFRPIVFSEMLRKWAAKFNYHPNDIIQLFKNIGYKCYVIKEDMLKEIELVYEDTIETNYFFLHNNKHKDIIQKICM